MVRVSLKDQEGHSAPQRPGGVHLAKRNSRSHFQQVQFGSTSWSNRYDQESPHAPLRPCGGDTEPSRDRRPSRFPRTDRSCNDTIILAILTFLGKVWDLCLYVDILAEMLEN